METELYYITVATKPHLVLENIRTNVSKNGESIIVLGEQEDRLIGWEANRNFGIKLREVAEFIKNPLLKHNDIILFTDAYDVAYCGNFKQILDIYVTFEKPIVFGAEKHCNPIPDLSSQYLYRQTEFPYLNSGLFIGRVDALRKCMEGYVYDDRHDDQLFWTRKFFEYPELIELDYENRLFLNTVSFDISKFEIDREKNRVLYKKRNPIFIHVNGPDKTMIRMFLPSV